ncbi:MAG: CoA transferase [Candidatus Baltobacteraceae bacterium]|jgi:crotonobetainyl-CoA:carnitine CoA-transferase CaiB-like acyl-CoA transferase
MDETLQGVRVVTLAQNVPGPVAAARLHALGAHVLKVEPPGGDPLAGYSPSWYAQLHRGCEVVQLDLKRPGDRAALEGRLGDADVLLASNRPSALQRLGLGWEAVHARHPRLLAVAIVGYPPPHEDLPGHDLTYVAKLGLVDPPHMPLSLFADLAGAERAVAATLALLYARERTGRADRATVSLAEAAEGFAAPLRHGLTAPEGLLGGSLAGYRVYRARHGWIALAALEPHFWSRFCAESGTGKPGEAALTELFLQRDAADWEAWASERDLPLVAVA